jgi:F-type H+-transporting ATPase subunit c
VLQAYVFATLDLELPERRASTPATDGRMPSSDIPPPQEFHLMDPVAAKYIGAGLACLGMAGAASASATCSASSSRARCAIPSAAEGQRGTLLLGFALTEALGIFSLLIALLLLFAV